MAGLDGDVKIPVVGTVKKKYAVIGLGTLAVILGVAYYRHRSATGTSVAAPVDASTDGGVVADTSTADGLGGFDSSGGGADFGDPNTSTGSVTAAGPTYANNEEWASAAEAALGDTAAVSNAINRVLGGRAVTSNQKGLFDEALGLIGTPPSPYPPIHVTNAGGQSPKPPAKRYETASGHDTLNALADIGGISEAKLIQLNPGLKHYEGTKHNVRKGTKVRIA